MTHHTFNFRIYYEDTDAGGVVYYPNYFKFAERARTELLREAGFTNSTLREEAGIIYVVRHLEASYHKPAHLEDELEMRTVMTDLGRSSFIMKQSLYKSRILIFETRVTLVCVGVDTLKPVKLPPDVRAAFEPYLEEDS